MNRQFVLAAIFVILSPLARAQQLSPKPENLLLITVDALRADHLGCYGYSRPTSPRMDRLAAQGTVFESVQPTIPRTTQSLAALFSGLYPQRTGVLRLENDLPDSIVTMAEVMTAAGYDTACFVTHPLNLIGENGNNLQQGFAVSQKANKPTVEALSWFQSRQHKPFFVWLHYYDPHWRYEPSRQYDVFSDPIYRNPDARSAWNDLVRKPKGKIIYQNDWSANDVQHAIDLYDGEILEADAQIGELLDWLDSAGLLATTLIAVSADHGEGLGEHGYYFDHGETLYQGVTRVPLIFSGPGIPSGRRVKPNVELFDLFPTLVELMGAPPPPGLDAQSFAPLVLNQKSRKWKMDDKLQFLLTDISRFPENTRFHLPGEHGRWSGVVDHRYKLIIIPHKGHNEYELYDLRADPDETENLAAKMPGRVARLEEQVKRWRRRVESAPPQELPTKPDAELEEQLRELGYIN